MPERDELANVLWSLDARMQRFEDRLTEIEQQGATSLQKHDDTIRHLDRLNGSVGRHDTALTIVQQDIAFAKGQLAGRDQITARISARDRGFFVVVVGVGAMLATLIGAAATIAAGLWF